MDLRLLPRPPRAIRKTNPMPIGRALACLVLLAFATATAILGGYLLYDVGMSSLGRQATARVTMVRERRNVVTEGLDYLAAYSYTLKDGSTRTDESTVRRAVYAPIAEPFRLAGSSALTADGLDRFEIPPDMPAQIQIRSLELGPLILSRAADSDYAKVNRIAALVLLPAFLLATLALYLAVVVRPRRTRWLYAEGEAVNGTLVEKRAIAGKYGLSHHGYYAYIPRGNSEWRQGMFQFATPKDFAEAEQGATILVLYDPAKPKRSVPYAYGGYTWE